jgi:hypothetical protein
MVVLRLFFQGRAKIFHGGGGGQELTFCLKNNKKGRPGGKSPLFAPPPPDAHGLILHLYLSVIVLFQVGISIQSKGWEWIFTIFGCESWWVELEEMAKTNYNSSFKLGQAMMPREIEVRVKKVNKQLPFIVNFHFAKSSRTFFFQFIFNFFRRDLKFWLFLELCTTNEIEFWIIVKYAHMSGIVELQNILSFKVQVNIWTTTTCQQWPHI